MKTTFCFIEMEKSNMEPEKENKTFAFLVQRGLLLELKELGVLSESQYFYAVRLMNREERSL